jgi:uncharacterized repeat protein (TIGR04138 family)
MAQDFSEVIEEILRDDPRYAKNAYYFVRKALDFAVQSIAERSKRPVGHISGKQMLEGFRLYALGEFGPMALTVLESWGVRETMDVGAIVFNLVEHGVLGKTDKDSPEEFNNIYDFADAFEKPFLPKKRRRGGSLPPSSD